LTIFKILFIVEILLFFSIQIPAATSEDLFMADLIKRSLSKQNEFLTLLEIPGKRISPEVLDQTQSSLLINQIRSLPVEYQENCWYYFYSGLLIPDNNRENNFRLCLQKAEHNAGDAWLLFIAFSENNIQQWDEQALAVLKKQILELGAEQSLVLSRQMMQYSALQEKKGLHEKAVKLYQFSQQFGSDDIFQTYSEVWRNFPTVLINEGNVVGNLLHSFFNSPTIHIDIISYIYGKIRIVFFLIALSLIVAFVVRYLPYALHRIVDLFPSGIPYSLKILFITIAYSSFISIGLLPFFWFSSILIYKYLSKIEKSLFVFVFIVLCLIPLDVHVQSLLVRASNPDGDLKVLSRSVREGYSEKLYLSTISSISSDPENHLLRLAAVNQALKSGNSVEAIRHIEKALSLRPNDPVVLTTAGNVAYLKNDINRANKIYERAIEKAPNYSEALYNAGQCNLKQLQTVDGMELINKAVKHSSVRINSFIRTNDQFFADIVPLYRQIVFADYTPKLFWSSLAFQSIYSHSFASSYWGMALLGIPPIWSFFLSICLLLVLLIQQLQSGTKKPPKIFFECRYCGRILCRTCKEGSLCGSCADAARFVHNEYALEKLRTKITAQGHLMRNTSYYIADIIFPGIGYILRGELFFLRTAGLIVFTGLIYTIYYAIFSGSSFFGSFHYLHLLVLVPCITYSVFHMIKFLRLIIIEINNYVRSLEG
jgi:tetratricopeptide (TPR) repeat protein